MPAPTTTRAWVIQLIQAEIALRIIVSGELSQIVWDNDPTVLKDDGTRGRVTVKFLSRDKRSIGSKKAVYRQIGLITLQLFGDINIGPTQLDKVWFRVDDNFRSRSMVASNPDATVVRFLTPAQNIFGVLDGAYRMNVTLPFWFDEFLTIADPTV